MALFTKKEFTDFGVAIASVIKLAVGNHPGCLARELQKKEYPNRNFIPEGELEAALSQLYITNKNMFWEILRACPWNYGNNNWTNEPKVREKLSASVTRAGGDATAKKGEFWQNLLSILQPQSTTQNPTITETKPNTTGIIALVAVAIGLIVVFFIVFKKM